MKRIIAIALMAIASATATAYATPTWVVLGDSVMSFVPGGTSKDSALHLVSEEVDVDFRNLSSSGAALAASDYSGYNSPRILDALLQISGTYRTFQGILIQAGSNDFGRNFPWESTVMSLRRIMDFARTNSKKVLLLDPIWRYDEDAPNSIGHNLNVYRYMMFIVCAYEYQDVCTFAHRANTVMGTSAGSDHYSAAEIAVGIRLHPDVIGHRKLADWIKAEAAAAGYF